MAEHDPTRTRREQQELPAQEDLLSCPRCGRELGSTALQGIASQTKDESPMTGRELDLPPLGEGAMSSQSKRVDPVKVQDSASPEASSLLEAPVIERSVTYHAAGKNVYGMSGGSITLVLPKKLTRKNPFMPPKKSGGRVITVSSVRPDHSKTD